MQKKKKPKVTAQAPQLEQISFKVPLSAAMGVYVPDEVQAWRAANNTGDAHDLFLGGDRFGDAPWRIKTLKFSDVEWSAAIQMLTTSMSVTMEEAPVQASKKKKKNKKKNKPGSGGSSTVPDSGGGGSSSSSTPITERYRNSKNK